MLKFVVQQECGVMDDVRVEGGNGSTNVNIELVEDEPESPDGTLEHAGVGNIEGVATVLQSLQS